MKEVPKTHTIIPSFKEVEESKEKFVLAFKGYYQNKNVAQEHGGPYLVQFPMEYLTTSELDAIYNLPFTRKHPYKKKVPALDPVKFSVTTHRGCFGECSFCAIYFHQGRDIRSRSQMSIIKEIERLTKMSDFHGTIDDLGGPSANMYGMDCAVKCDRPDGCFECKNLDQSHERITKLLKNVRRIPGVRHIFVSSGVRHDLAMASNDYLKELLEHHVPGRLKVAPEHVNDHVMDLMGKPHISVYIDFLKRVKDISPKTKVLPYFIAAHPGCSIKQMEDVLEFTKKYGEHEQCQVFTPTPMTRSTCMYHTGIDPLTDKKVYVPTTFSEKKIQKAMLTPSSPSAKKRLKNADLI